MVLDEQWGWMYGTGLLGLVTLGLQALVDVNLSVPQQPHHSADQLDERVGPVQNIFLGQIPGEEESERIRSGLMLAAS